MFIQQIMKNTNTEHDRHAVQTKTCEMANI